MMMVMPVMMMVKVAGFNDFHCHGYGHSGGGGEISGARGWPEKQRKHVFSFLSLCSFQKLANFRQFALRQSCDDCKLSKKG